MRYVLIPKFCSESGYSEKAVRRKIEEGVWVQNHHYRRAPDGHILIDLVGYEKWAEGQPAQLSRGKAPSGSSSRTAESAA